MTRDVSINAAGRVRSACYIASVDVRSIPGHPGYFADAEGGIYCNTRRGRPSAARLERPEPMRKLRPTVQWVRNYQRTQVTLGRGHQRKVSRIVALTFLGPPPTPGHEVAHLNGNSLDNRAANLAWKTKSENEADRVLHGTSNRGERQGASKLTEADVRAIRVACRTKERQDDIAARFGIAQGHVSMIKNRKQWAWLDD